MADMILEIEGYIAELRDLRAEMTKWCDGLSADAANWKPPVKDTNSIYQIVTHVVGSEAWWIQQIIGGVDVQRDRPAEFAASGDDLDVLRARMASVAERNEAVLRGLTADDLRSERDSTLGRRDVRWGVLHVIEHWSRHVGHIELTRQLYETLQR